MKRSSKEQIKPLEILGKVENEMKGVIPHTMEEYLQMKYTLSPHFYLLLRDGSLNN